MQYTGRIKLFILTAYFPHRVTVLQDSRVTICINCMNRWRYIKLMAYVHTEKDRQTAKTFKGRVKNTQIRSPLY